jgi:hypothetical protein
LKNVGSQLRRPYMPHDWQYCAAQIAQTSLLRMRAQKPRASFESDPAGDPGTGTPEAAAAAPEVLADMLSVLLVLVTAPALLLLLLAERESHLKGSVSLVPTGHHSGSHRRAKAANRK